MLTSPVASSSSLIFAHVFISTCTLPLFAVTPDVTLSKPFDVIISCLNADENGNGVGTTVLHVNSSGRSVVERAFALAVCALACPLFLQNNMSRRCSRKRFIRMLYNTGLTKQLKVSNTTPVLFIHGFALLQCSMR